MHKVLALLDIYIIPSSSSLGRSLLLCDRISVWQKVIQIICKYKQANTFIEFNLRKTHCANTLYLEKFKVIFLLETFHLHWAGKFYNIARSYYILLYKQKKNEYSILMNDIFPIWKLEGFFDTVFLKNWPFFFSIKKFHRSLITKYKIIFNQNKILFYLLINILIILIVTYLYRIRIKPFGKTYPTCIFQLANL